MAYTTINKSTDYFNTKLFTGNGGTNAITGVGFQPDLIWLKNRDNTDDHSFYDAVRGVTKRLRPNGTNAETTQSNGVTAFGADGFTVGDHGGLNGNGQGIASWNWKANGAGSANTAGSISSTVSANTTSGFSTVTFTGTGAGATVGHGLGTIPKMILIKSLSGATSNWIVYHNSIGNGKALSLNTTAGESADAGYFNSTTPTSTVFSLGVDGFSNGSGQPMIAYCFADVQGYSKFGSYTGNGSLDGTFVYTGFKPAFVILKHYTGAGNDWVMKDSKRPGYNQVNDVLYPNLSNAEGHGADMDMVSNGFKFRTTGAGSNDDGTLYLYMAFAEAPLVGTNNVPANAR